MIERAKTILQEEDLIQRYKARRLEYIVACCHQLKVCPAEHCGLVLCMEINSSSFHHMKLQLQLNLKPLNARRAANKCRGIWRM